MLNHVLHLLSSILVPAFLCGMVGSAAVVLVTVFRDVRDFRTKDAPEGPEDGLKTAV